MSTPLSGHSFAGAQAALARARAQRATQQYQQTQTHTVTPGQLVILLYDGAIRFLRQAQAAITGHDVETAHNAICRAEDIVMELDATLDASKGGEIAEQLHTLYLFCYRRLVEANMQKDPGPIQEVIGILDELLEAWRGAVAQIDTQGTPGNAGGVQIEFPHS